MTRVIVSMFLAIALAAAGGISWSALFRINERVAPSLPWAAAIMAVLVALLWRALSRSSAVRPLLQRPEQGPRAFLAATTWAGCSIFLILLGLRFGDFPEGAFASDIDMDTLPVHMRVVRVLAAAGVAAFFEEVGFRGFLLDALTRRFGPVSASIGTAVIFYSLHLGHDWSHGDLKTVLAVAIPFLVTGVGLGALTLLSGSLLPVFLTHALIDVVLLPMEWTNRHNLEPIYTTGLDLHFALCAIGFVACLALSVLTLVRLKPARRVPPDDSVIG